MATVLVSGALANKPFNGGNAWSRLSWVVAWRRLGFQVIFIEQIRGSDCVDASGCRTSFRDSVNVEYFHRVMDGFGLSGSSSLILDEGVEAHGLAPAELAARAREAVLLFNISGHLTMPEINARAGCRIYYDDDPGYTQFWAAEEGGGSRMEGHDFHFTIGANIGAPECAIPAGLIHWRHTRPPVVLEDWPALAAGSFHRFTTVASWRGAYGGVRHEGKTYGQKAHEFRKFMELPRRSGHGYEIALEIHPGDCKDLDALLARGWQVVNPRKVAASPEDFRRYVQESGAEFSVAQGIYVDTNSGWFSDRTVRYLASGRPALVQDTGISRHYPVGGGLLTFRTMEEAIEGADRIVKDHAAHCRAARRVAEECFDSDRVIGRLVAEVGLELPRGPARRPGGRAGPGANQGGRVASDEAIKP